MSIENTPQIKSFWNEFLQTRDDLSHLKDYKYEIWSFGNTKEMADELGALVLEGKKRATCSLLRAYNGYENEIPKVGVYSVLCNGDKEPIAIIFLTETFIRKFNEITPEFAAEEGEGDLSYEYWRKAHIEFFSGYGNFQEDELIICERFIVAYK